MKVASWSSLLFACAIAVTAHADNAQTVSGTVKTFQDGDSFVIKGYDYDIRLADIDAPEKGQDYWRKARTTLRDLVGSNVVTCTRTGWDSKWKRLVARCKAGDADLGEAMVREGLAWNTKGGPYAALMAEAQKELQGLWHDSDAEEPWDYRKRERFPWMVAAASALASSLLTLLAVAVWGWRRIDVASR